MSDPVLEFKSVSKSYHQGEGKEIVVLRDVSFHVAPGELVGLVAPSGSGKSTLLHIAGLLDASDGGQVLLNGQDIGRATERARTRARREQVGFVYQFHHLLPEFTAAENVALPQLANGVDHTTASAKAMNLLDNMGLRARANHRPATMSGGEQQRVAIARALANNPALLLADEPTGNLDPDTSDRVFDALVGLAREQGLAGVIATHNMALAAKMDRVLRLDHGALGPA